MKRTNITRHIRSIGFSVIVLGGFGFSALFLSHILMGGIATLIVLWLFNAMVSQWEKRLPVTDLIFRPLLRTSEESYFSKAICEECYDRFAVLFFISPTGLIALFFLTHTTYLVLCGLLMAIDRELFFSWLSLFHPFFDWYAMLFPTWAGIYDAWSEVGLPHMAIVRLHFFGVFTISGCLFLIYQIVHIFRLNIERGIMLKAKKSLSDTFSRKNNIIITLMFFGFLWAFYSFFIDNIEKNEPSFLFDSYFIELNIFFVSLNFIFMFVGIFNFFFFLCLNRLLSFLYIKVFMREVVG